MLLAEHIRQLIQGKILEVYGFVLIAAQTACDCLQAVCNADAVR